MQEKNNKVGLVLEGGALMGMFTAGVLDSLMESNIDIDSIIGVSAGALFGVNYYSNQKGRALRYNKKYLNHRNYISFSSFLRTGNMINKDFAFYKITKSLDPVDVDTFVNANKKYIAVATNLETGLPEYLDINNPFEQIEELRATSAVPLLSRIIKINAKKYLDGAIGDSIPVEKMKELGYKKIIVVLTRPLEYRKKQLNIFRKILMRIRYFKYPLFLKAAFNRHNMYNESIKNIIDMENSKDIFVIRPSKPIIVKMTENNPNKLQEIYDLGVDDFNKNKDNLLAYIQKTGD